MAMRDTDFWHGMDVGYRFPRERCCTPLAPCQMPALRPFKHEIPLILYLSLSTPCLR